MSELELPYELKSLIGNAKIDFIVHSKRIKPLNKSIESIVWGFAILAFISIFVIAFLGPVFRNSESHFLLDGVATSASWDNFQPLLIPTIIFTIITICGLKLVLYGIYSIFKKGGIYVATNANLYFYAKRKVKSFDWEQFTGNIEINLKNGNVYLELRKGQIANIHNNEDEFVPEGIDIIGVDNVINFDKVCRQRIKENDPTPSKIY